jgi:uncharacterized membrane-anchored protein YhcB (DUF1043 family)
VGETPAETLTEIEATRVRLDGELRELEDRLPATARMAKRVIAVVVGVGVLGAMTRFAMRRRKHQQGEGRLRDIEKRLARLERQTI